jgi:hypothetical protein
MFEGGSIDLRANEVERVVVLLNQFLEFAGEEKC